jgi:hypothetical protein
MPDKIAAKKTIARETVAPARKTTAKTTSKNRATRGDSFVCGTCGLSLLVDEWGDVVGVQEVICCGKPMKQRTRKAKTPAK